MLFRITKSQEEEIVVNTIHVTDHYWQKKRINVRLCSITHVHKIAFLIKEIIFINIKHIMVSWQVQNEIGHKNSMATAIIGESREILFAVLTALFVAFV